MSPFGTVAQPKKHTEKISTTERVMAQDGSTHRCVRSAFRMSRSVVEKYTQILAQDPSSTVFVELAKAFIDKGDHARAIEVCQQGLSHHPKSVVGRVMWGKALINLGKA